MQDEVTCPRCTRVNNVDAEWDSVRCAGCEGTIHRKPDHRPFAGSLSPFPSEKAKQVGGSHYQGEVQPWDLIKSMKPSGDLFLDHARASVIAYVYRIKGEEENMKQLLVLAEDMEKAIHYLQEACRRIEHLIKK